MKNHLNSALRKIQNGEVAHLYVSGNFATVRHIDYVSSAGYFDAIWFDLEHFDIPTRELAVLVLVAKANEVSAIARVKAMDYQVVARTLESGVDGLMCPMVANAEEAHQIVKWAKFNNPNPLPNEITGQRGWNGGNIDADYGRMPAADYMRIQNTQTMIICQIENEDALANAREIAAVPGVDGLFFGPGDYSASLGLVGQLTHSRVYQAMGQIAEAARDAGKWWGTVAVGREMYTKAKALGGQLICPGGDVKVMNLGLKALWQSFQNESEPASNSSSGPAEPRTAGTY